MVLVVLLSLVPFPVDIRLVGIGYVVDLEVLTTISGLMAGGTEDGFAAKGAKLRSWVTHRRIRCHVLDDAGSLRHVPR